MDPNTCSFHAVTSAEFSSFYRRYVRDNQHADCVVGLLHPYCFEHLNGLTCSTVDCCERGNKTLDGWCCLWQDPCPIDSQE
jgi:hypothetical protein